MTTTQPRTRRWYTWRDLLALSILLALIGSTHWLTFNISPSVPVGLYRFVPIEVPVHRGDLLHLPAVRFGHSWFYRRLIPLLKPVAAVPGRGGLRAAGRALGPGQTLWCGVHRTSRWPRPGVLGLSCGGGGGGLRGQSRGPKSRWAVFWDDAR